jgi:uncharacterized membrane protein YhiD involved in acid resistance
VQLSRDSHIPPIREGSVIAHPQAVRLLRALLVALLLATAADTLLAQQAQPPAPPRAPTSTEDLEQHRAKHELPAETPEMFIQVDQLGMAAARLPIAAALACMLALRPRRRGTPPRQAPVIQTQIILAVVGAVVMLVVGSSLARAFGIVGAAGLVRYRSKIEDPKDAGVMLSTLAIGLAAGVGLWLLAVFTTVFVLAVLWTIESFEKATHLFGLKVKAKDPAAIRPQVERLLQNNRVKYELRSISQEELWYDVHVPVERKTDRLSEQILDIDRENGAVQWDEKKEKKSLS